MYSTSDDPSLLFVVVGDSRAACSAPACHPTDVLRTPECTRSHQENIITAEQVSKRAGLRRSRLIPSPAVYTQAVLVLRKTIKTKTARVYSPFHPAGTASVSTVGVFAAADRWSVYKCMYPLGSAFVR